MLAELIQARSAVHTFDIDGFIDALKDIFDKSGYLVEGDSAQFAAGYLYAASGQYIDKRDYIVGCSQHDDDLDRILEDAFAAYNNGDEDRGDQNLVKSHDKYQGSMSTCDDTNGYFKQLDDLNADFFAQKNWKDTVKNNYDSNKDYIDQQWQFCLDAWNTGVYFNSGMFYERVWLSMSGIAPISP